jgi:hypothetical protein
MSAAQKTAQANFKKAIAYRKKTGCSLKDAFAYVKGGKVAKPAKKVGATKLIEMHETKKTPTTKTVKVVRDKKGHFKKFETVGNFMFNAPNSYNKILWDFTSTSEGILQCNNVLKNLQSSDLNKDEVNRLKKYLSELKKHKSELKKLL